jgi:ATP-dependent NAD(P)H-hydrate dehydratase
MVHPYLVGSSHLRHFAGSSSTSKSSESSEISYGSSSVRQEDLATAVSKRITDTVLARLHVLIVGPGLSRDEPLLAQAALVLQSAREKKIPVVIDADGLGLVIEKPERVKGWGECILTPNVAEFERICKAMNVKPAQDGNDREDRVKALAKALDGPVVISKGATDIIAAPRGIATSICDWKGGLKRSGGQGDTLTGVLGTMLAWRKGYHDGLWGEDDGQKMTVEETMLVCAFAGSAITRECSRLAYEEKGRSLQAGDLTEKVHQAFQNVVGEDPKL